jgi:hypothetical protein
MLSSTFQGPDYSGLDSSNSRLGVIQSRVPEEELTLTPNRPATQGIIPVGFWSRVRIENLAAHVYSVKVKVHEQLRDNEFGIESRKSHAEASRPP